MASVYTTELFCSPVQYFPPSLIPPTSQWRDFIMQGVNFLSVELAQQGLTMTYSEPEDTIYVDSAICDDVESVEFNLVIKIDQFGCTNSGGGK